jgi:hypothetical protein
MANYSYYNPAQASMQRQAGVDRLMTILDSRRQEALAKAEMAKLEKESAAQLAQEKQGAWDNMGSMWGSAAQGAGIGAMSGNPYAIAGGAVGGLVLGGIAEAKSRKDFKGDSSYGWGDAIRDTVVRAPNMNEVGTMLQTGASIGAQQVGQQARQSQAAQDMAAYGNSQAAFERTMRTGSSDLNAATGPYAPTPTMGQSYSGNSSVQPPQLPDSNAYHLDNQGKRIAPGYSRSEG